MTESDGQQIFTLPKHVAAPIGEYGKTVRMVGLVLVILALVSVVVSFLVLTGLTPITPSDTVLTTAVVINAALLLALTGLVLWELVGLYIAWKDGRAAARLHWRILTHFSLIAAAPAVLVTVLASITLDQGLDRWFETRTRTIVDNAAQVGAAYLQEHARVLRGDAIALAAEIDQAKPLYDFEPSRFDTYFENQAILRQVPAAFLLKADGTIVTSVKLDQAWENPLMPPTEAFEKAENDEPVLIKPGPASNQVGAVIKLKEFDEFYLYATRPLDGRVLDQVRLAEAAAGAYGQLEASRAGVQIAFALIFVGVTLILLLAAIWTGIGFANRLVAPIRRLILAADYVSKGNLAVQVPVREKEGDLAHLGETFNTMTTELRSQRAELIAAKDQIDRRRRFTEAMLAGVTAGVIGVDGERRITLANRSALTLLDATEADMLGRTVDEAVPELALVMTDAMADLPARPRAAVQVTIRRAGQERTINVRFTAETSGAADGLVVTLDDITDLVTAQRSSAWADVARRIAHEIKNPLTPIQLSAERIRRRYAKKVEDDRQVFDQCVDTIIRQVGDIERMVNEFSSFARMPKPQKTKGDLRDPLKESVFLISVSNPEIEFVTRLPDAPMVGRFDNRLLSQVFTNVVKNATEAIAAVDPAERVEKGRVEVVARQDDHEIVVDVIDNGIGFPVENRHRLLEPYVTTREKGTGLGLAIVRKILEEHGGRIELLDAPAVASGGRGAMMRLVMPTYEADAKGASEESGGGAAASEGPATAGAPGRDRPALAS